jgi:hypothetical protein
MLFDVRQSLIGVFLIVNKLKSFSENLSATAMIHQQTIFALKLIRDWPEDEHLGAARCELRKIADGLAFVADMGDASSSLSMNLPTAETGIAQWQRERAPREVFIGVTA